MDIFVAETAQREDKVWGRLANTVTFISWRRKLTKLLAGVAKGKREVSVGKPYFLFPPSGNC
jgi:hypothetical protein